MEYQTFLKVVAEAVTTALPRDYFITVYPVRKNNNCIWDAFVVKGGDFSPAIYALPYYKQYKSGVSLSQIQMEITAISQQVCSSQKGTIRFEYDPAQIIFRLVGYESNYKWLEEVPHRLFLDMAVIYSVALFQPNDGWRSILITNQIQQMWKKTESELYDAAKQNTPQMFPPSIRRLNDLIRQLQKFDQKQAFSLTDCIKGNIVENKEMYIVTNQANFYGAACMCYPHIWQKLANSVNVDLAVTPLSVHELVAVPFQKYDTWELFQQTAIRTYRTVPVPNERLTPSVYRFSRETGTFSLVF